MVAFSQAAVGGTRPPPPPWRPPGISPSGDMAGGQRRFADTWGPSALRLGFLFGTAPSPDLRAPHPPSTPPDPLSYSYTYSYPASSEDEEEEDLDEEEYVTLDYSYLPPPSPGVSLAAPPPYPAPSLHPTTLSLPPTAPILPPSHAPPWSWTRGAGRYEGGGGGSPGGQLFFERSHSLPDLQAVPEEGGDEPSVVVGQARRAGVGGGEEGGGSSGMMGSGVSLVGSNYSDDEDGDEFGFLSSGLAPSPPVLAAAAAAAAAMQKAKSPSPSHRILPRSWRPRSKAAATTPGTPASLWSPEGSSAWCSVSGRRVVLRPVSLLEVCEAERLALQRVALSKLQSLDLGCTVAIPRESTGVRRSKRKMLSLKRRSKSANLASSLEEVDRQQQRDRETKDCKPVGLVFGIPLSECIANDLDLQNRGRRTRTDDVTQEPAASRRSSSSSQSSDDLEQNGSLHSSHNGSRQRPGVCESVSDSEASSLVDALSLSLSRDSSRHASLRSRPSSSSAGPPGPPLVPHVVQACFQHIHNYGLHTLGIFRVGASKKRVKQLREAFDSGCDVMLDASHNPHDVGALLKEYFRDLPEPLLTRDLYQPFVSTSRLPDVEQQLRVLRYLVCLLPAANCHTLAALLTFLALVSRHATDCLDGAGCVNAGNRMDSHNLATLFGPNLLHKMRSSGEREFQVESAEQAQQSKDVIQVVKVMIDNHDRLLKLPPSVRDEGLRELLRSDPEAADRVLKQLANQCLLHGEEEAGREERGGLRPTLSSEADLLSETRRLALTHPPVRRGHSADPALPWGGQHRGSPGGSAGSSCPPPGSDQTWPPPRLTVTRAAVSPEVVRRWRGEGRHGGEWGGEGAAAAIRRPLSESVVQGLAVPPQGLGSPLLPQSPSSGSSGLSSAPSPPTTPEATSQRLTPAFCKSRSVSPGPPIRPPTASPSISSSSSAAPPANPSPMGSAQWQREKWKHWEMIAAERSSTEDSPEQETLV